MPRDKPVAMKCCPSLAGIPVSHDLNNCEFLTTFHEPTLASASQVEAPNSFFFGIRNGESHLAVFRFTNVTNSIAVVLFISANRAGVLRCEFAFDIKVALSVQDDGLVNRALEHFRRS